MLTKRIIPCLDVKNGVVVKGINFKNLRDVGNPAELAQKYEKDGADEVVFLDIAASLESRKTMITVVEETSDNLFIPLTVGGGIHSVGDIKAVLNAGADKVSVNTAAVQNPEIIAESSDAYGCQCIVVAIDAKRTGDSWKIYTYGGTKATDIDAIEWARKVEALGAGEILLTSMDADGTTAGYDNKLTRAISENVNIPVIASGGAGTLEHIYDTLTDGKADAALAASIFHYGTYTPRDVKELLQKKGVAVRL
jgi:cyclase